MPTSPHPRNPDREFTRDLAERLSRKDPQCRAAFRDFLAGTMPLQSFVPLFRRNAKRVYDNNPTLSREFRRDLSEWLVTYGSQTRGGDPRVYQWHARLNAAEHEALQKWGAQHGLAEKADIVRFALMQLIGEVDGSEGK